MPRRPCVLSLSAGLFLAAALPAAGQIAQQDELLDAPSSTLIAKADAPLLPEIDVRHPDMLASMSGEFFGEPPAFSSSLQASPDQTAADAAKQLDRGKDQQQVAPGQQQQTRIFGVFANFQSVSAGATPPKAGWRTDFAIANRSNYDYTAVGFLFLTSGLAYAQNSHPLVSTVNGGNAPFWAYLWRGFADKTDGSYQGQFLFPALLHEDVRYYAMGSGSIVRRTLHAAASVVVAHSYSGRPIPNIAGLGGKVGAQAVSTTYYPSNSEDFGVLASKFAYSCLRQAGFSVLREFSPDLRAHVGHHRPTATATP